MKKQIIMCEAIVKDSASSGAKRLIKNGQLYACPVRENGNIDICLVDEHGTPIVLEGFLNVYYPDVYSVVSGVYMKPLSDTDIDKRHFRELIGTVKTWFWLASSRVGHFISKWF